MAAAFLENLDQMHARVMLSFPDLKPPSFRVTDRTDDRLTLHYYSSRPGLAPLVVGLLKGLADRFHTDIEIEHRNEQDDQGEHDVFDVSFRTSSVGGDATWIRSLNCTTSRVGQDLRQLLGPYSNGIGCAYGPDWSLLSAG